MFYKLLIYPPRMIKFESSNPHIKSITQKNENKAT